MPSRILKLTSDLECLQIRDQYSKDHLEKYPHKTGSFLIFKDTPTVNIQKTKIMASSPITSWQIDGETVDDFIFWTSKSLQMVIAAMKLKEAYSLEGKL